MCGRRRRCRLSKFSLYAYHNDERERERASGDALNTHILVYRLTFIRWYTMVKANVCVRTWSDFC